MSDPRPDRDGSSRRDFLQRSAALGLSALLGREALTPLLADRPRGPETVLVLVQLSGGNDGLSMVVPHADPVYHARRTSTRHEANAVLRLDGSLGFNPALAELHRHFGAGALAVVPGCGYPRPNRSHFESMDIWHAADERGAAVGRGWLGRWADATLPDPADPNAMVAVGKAVPLALRADRAKAVAFRNPLAYRVAAREEQRDPLRRVSEAEIEAERPVGESDLDFLRRVARRARESSFRIRRAVEGYRPKVNYGPGGRLGVDLRLAASLIAARLGTRVIHCTLGGFDTHVNQRPTHDARMRELSRALDAFQRDLAAGGHADRVVTLVFSEFGRRVAENGSQGTDHGTAGPVLLLGEPLRGGLYGSQPSLTDLDARGDMKMTTDFRAIYASLVERWLGGSAKTVLGPDRRPLADLLPERPAVDG
ncbi:MAG: DUF1501 domain-containing protein [Planctomycetota bacterium]